MRRISPNRAPHTMRRRQIRLAPQIAVNVNAPQITPVCGAALAAHGPAAKTVICAAKTLICTALLYFCVAKLILCQKIF